jgi:hypothetical protein
MLSVIIPTLDSERALDPTLSALVPGATAGLVSDVLVADGGSRRYGGGRRRRRSTFLRGDGPLGRRLKTAIAWARAWLSSCEERSTRPGSARRRTLSSGRRPIPCRRIPPRRPAQSTPAMRSPSLPRRSAPGASRQGLIISKRLYEKIGGHSESAADPEADLIHRIGRRRIVRLATRASWVGRDT